MSVFSKKNKQTNNDAKAQEIAKVIPEAADAVEPKKEEPVVAEKVEAVKEEPVKEAPAEKKPEVAPEPQVKEKSVIGKGMKITGDIEYDGDVKVQGNVIGTIKLKKDSFLLLDEAYIKGNIECGSLKMNGGKVEGNVTVRDSATINGEILGNITVSIVSIQENAHVVGDVTAKSINVAEGAFIDSKISILREGKK